MSGMFSGASVFKEEIGSWDVYPVCRHNKSNNIQQHNSIDAVEETAVALLVVSNVLPLFHLQHHY
jgi:hypothetical protein